MRLVRGYTICLGLADATRLTPHNAESDLGKGNNTEKEKQEHAAFATSPWRRTSDVEYFTFSNRRVPGAKKGDDEY